MNSGFSVKENFPHFVSIAVDKSVNPLLIKLSKETGIKLVATNDVHYLEKKDAKRDAKAGRARQG